LIVAPSGEASLSAPLWERVGEIIERAPSLEALRRHRIHLLAGRFWRSEGQYVPAELLSDEREAAMIALAVPPVLERIRAVCSGEIVLMKGPEVAACYPDPLVRPFRDLDLLVADPPSAQRALLDHGFVELGEPAFYADHHHLRPLIWPSLPVTVELHRQPNIARGTRSPSFDELLELTVPSATGIASLVAPAPAAHAVLLANHGWAHEPLGRLLDLIDVAVTLTPADRAVADELARRWECERLWRITVQTVDALLLDPTEPFSPRRWARHLARGRERAVVENHIARLAGAVWGAPRTQALQVAAAVLLAEGNRRSGETWSAKLRRTRLAVSHAFMVRSEHEQKLHTPNGGNCEVTHQRP